MDYQMPTSDQAHEFALMLQAGLPPSDAIGYFYDEMHPDAAKDLGAVWAGSRAVRLAKEAVLGGNWAKLSPQERIKRALDKHYNEMAWFLMRHNYAELNHPALKGKADTCRQALEAKLAGMAGQMSALSRFWEDMMRDSTAVKAAKNA